MDCFWGPDLISTHMTSWSWSSRSSTLVTLLVRSFLTAMAMPPPSFPVLFLLIHSYPSSLGMSPCILVSVIVMIWLLCVLAAVFRQSIFLVIPFALAYILFILLSFFFGWFLCMFFFFDLFESDLFYDFLDVVFLEAASNHWFLLCFIFLCVFCIGIVFSLVAYLGFVVVPVAPFQFSPVVCGVRGFFLGVIRGFFLGVILKGVFSG